MSLDTHAALHEEGGHEGGNDRQDKVADLIGGDVLEEFHTFHTIKLNI